MISIRQYKEEDWPARWSIVEPVFRSGETYAFSPNITEKEAYAVWIESPLATYVAINENNEIWGTYYIKPNQPDLGAHVCNSGYIVSKIARGKGIASKMCEHSQQEAINLGFKSMQYNLVVATNEVGVHLWKKHGFEIVGTLSEAFRHPKQGLIDAYVMYKKLEA
jgi:ribosomal protein S18 acetylase RimI-like enzyme